jgi:tetratricopeptide (TPR) repeat protein
MQRPQQDTRLDETLAREVAQREGVRAVISSEIDRVDSSYLLTTRLIDAESGTALAAESGTASRAQVLDVLGAMLSRLRRQIGESAEALRQHDLPLPRITTRSLDALRKYADGDRAFNTGRHDAALQLWQQAIELDSNFALAHSSLGVAFYWRNDRPEGDRHFDRAFALLDRLTPREQLIVRAQAASWRGNREQAVEVRHALLTEYPDDASAWGAQAYDLLRLGRPAESIDAQKHYLALDSTNAGAYINLATAYKALAGFDDALLSYRHAFRLQPSLLTSENVNGEYGSLLVFMGRVDDARAAFDSMLRGNASQQALAQRSLGMLAMYRGRYAEAIDHFRAAALLHHTDQRAMSEARSRLLLAAAEDEKGWRDSVQKELHASYLLFKSTYFVPAFLSMLGKALATHGDTPYAREVFDSLVHRERAESAEDRAAHLMLAGEIALAEGRPDSAVQLLTLGYAADSSAYNEESLARALAAAKNLPAAARTYDAFAARRGDWYGWEPESYALVAPLMAGRLLEESGDTARARREYERMLNQWREGDTDLVDLREARRRLARFR